MGLVLDDFQVDAEPALADEFHPDRGGPDPGAAAEDDAGLRYLLIHVTDAQVPDRDAGRRAAGVDSGQIAGAPSSASGQ